MKKVFDDIAYIGVCLGVITGACLLAYAVTSAIYNLFSLGGN